MKTILALALAAASVHGQTFEARLAGQINDTSGARIAGVRVTVTNVSTGRAVSVESNQAGVYTAAGLAPGQYDAVAEHAGFKRLERRGLTLQVNQTATLDFVLTVGAVTESVLVTAEAPLLNAESGAKGQVIDNNEIVDLPLNGRDFNELAYLTPGVVDLPEGIATSNSGVTAINGGRADGVNYLVDGMNNRNVRNGSPVTQPSVDAVQEFKVQTSAYAADFGTVGSGLINVALKSGTNHPHGTLYEFARNDVFDARNFFDAEKGELSRHAFGGTIGGPVVLPKLYRGHDRTHFFFSYEGLLQDRGDARLARVPTPAERNGDFSSLLTGARPIYLRDPALSGTCSATVREACFPGNVIPANRINPTSTKVLKLVPLPNRVGANNFQTSQVNESTGYTFIAKLDQRVNDRVQIAFSYVTNGGSGGNPYGASNLPGFGLSSVDRNQLTGIRSTQVLRPSLTNDVRLTVSRSAGNSDWRRREDPDLMAAIQALSLYRDEVRIGLPRITITGYDQIGHHASYPATTAVTGYQVFDTVSIVKGRHYLRTGGEVQRTQYFQFYPNNGRGTITFQGRVTGGTATPVPMADFLLGLPESSNRLLDPRKNYMFYTTTGLFAQDDYKITRHLTLNIGLRYDLMVPPYEKYNLMSNFIPSLNRVAVSGEPGLPRALIRTDRNNLAPRFGFAWRPFGADKWVWRGGYGIFYTNAAQNGVRILLANNFPFSNSQNFQRLTTDPLAFTIANPFPTGSSGVLAATIPTGAQTDADTPYMQNFNFTVERQLDALTVAEVSYAGSRGTHLPRKYDINQQDRADPRRIVRPYPAFNGAIQYIAFGSSSSYHALQATLRRSFRKGVGFRANFVWSKSLDEVSGLTGTGSEGAAQDSRNLRLERGLSGFNRPRAFTLDFSYQIPYKGAALRPLLRGWQLNGITRLYDGQPFTPSDSTFSFAQGESSRPDRIGSGKLAHPAVERWFNVDDFVQVPTGAFRFGTSGRNILLGPPKRQIDLSLMKNFYLAKEQRLQFRAEVFNAPNIANFYLPVQNVDVNNGGTITRAQPGREIQFGLKYIF